MDPATTPAPGSPSGVTPSPPTPAPQQPQAPALQYMLDKEGQLVRVAAHQVEAAQGQGYVPLLDAEAHHLDTVNKYGGLGNELKTGALNALDAATFSGSSRALAATGTVPLQEQQGLNEANPNAATVGKVFGVVTPALLTGGESAVAQGARGANALRAGAELLPSAVVPRMGAAVAEAVAARGGGALLQGAARGALETSIYAVGDALSESHIENKPLTAEALVGTLGPAAILGAVGGGALEGALGLVASKAPAALERASAGLEKLAGRIESMSPEAKTGRLVAALETSKGAVSKGLDEAGSIRRDLLGAMLAEPARAEVLAATKPLRAAIESLLDAPPVVGRAAGVLERELGAAKSAADQFGAFERFAARAAKGGEVGQQVAQAARQFLEEPKVWGKAATLQQEWAAKASALDEARSALRETFGKGEKGVAKAVEAAGEDSHKGLVASKVLQGYVDSAKDLLKWATDRAGELPSGRRNVPQVTPILDSLVGAHGEAVKAAAPSMLEKVEHFLPHGIQGPIGAIGHLTRQSEAIAQAVSKTARVVDHIKEGVGAAVEGTRSKAWAGSASAAAWVTPQRGESSAQAVVRQGQALAELRASPEAARGKLEAGTAGVSKLMPDTTGHAQLVTTRAAAYLADKGTPKVYGQSLPGSPKPLPSATETARCQRVAEVVNAPLSALQLVQTGRLTLDHVDALKSVYPSLHQEIRRQVYAQLAQSQQPIPLERQVQLSILVGEPLAPALRLLPQFQAVYAQAPKPPAQGPATSSVRPTPIGTADRATRTLP